MGHGQHPKSKNGFHEDEDEDDMDGWMDDDKDR